MPNQLLTTTAAAAILGVTPQYVLVLINSGRLKASRFGRDWQIDPKVLAKLKRRPVGNPNFGKSFWKKRAKKML